MTGSCFLCVLVCSGSEKDELWWERVRKGREVDKKGRHYAETVWGKGSEGKGCERGRGGKVKWRRGERESRARKGKAEDGIGKDWKEKGRTKQEKQAW